MKAEDCIAIILGRAIIRAEALQAENEQLRARLAEHGDRRSCNVLIV